jgi:hypothetical protein
VEINNKEIEKEIKQSENNSGIIASMGAELLFGNEFPFFEAVQTNLMTRQLKLTQSNLKINLQNNTIMKKLLIENLKTNDKLSNINNEIMSLKSIIENKELREEREHIAKEIIYNLKLENKLINKSNDKLFIYFATTLLLKIIEENKLSTKDFTQIEDKEYFTELKEQLEFQENILDIEKKEIEGFIETYYLLNQLKDEINSDKYFVTKEMFEYNDNEISVPLKPEILDIEDELIESINSNLLWIMSYYRKLLKYTDKFEELPSIYKIYFEAKKKYELENIAYENYVNFKKQVELENEYLKNRNLIEELEKIVNRFLFLHKDFETYFNKISVVFKEKIFIKLNLSTVIENKQLKKMEELQLEYLKLNDILEKKILEKKKNESKENSKNILQKILNKLNIVK